MADEDGGGEGPSGGTFMPAKFIQDGNAIDHTPGADVPVGTVVVQGDLVGVSTARVNTPPMGSPSATSWKKAI